MKLQRLLVLGLVVLVGLVSACQPTAASLIGHDYQDWSRTTLTRLDYPIPGHMDKLREIYINPTANQVVIARDGGARSFRYPAGTVVIKEIFASSRPAAGEGPVALTGMVKAPDDPRSRGGWLWVMRDLKNGSEQVFTNEFCFTCHANANEKHPYGDNNALGEFRDYLYFPWDPTRPPVDPSASAKPASAGPAAYFGSDY